MLFPSSLIVGEKEYLLAEHRIQKQKVNYPAAALQAFSS